ncbi:MAG: hypothetical protein HY862_03550 [Chloroflexi bacterium]|nr:hypothetical protein [Chloroflexota bacterium]
MKLARKMIVTLVLVGILALLAVPALAAGSRTKTITEDTINSSYRVSNPYRSRVSNLSVDLQPDQVVVSSTHNFRNASYDVVTTLTPTVSNGRVTWTVLSATSNGEAVSADLLAQINASITSSWRNFIKNQAGSGRITSIVITDTDITYTIETR